MIAELSGRNFGGGCLEENCPTIFIGFVRNFNLMHVSLLHGIS